VQHNYRKIWLKQELAKIGNQFVGCVVLGLYVIAALGLLKIVWKHLPG
jgi:hypothetical protein